MNPLSKVNTLTRTIKSTSYYFCENTNRLFQAQDHRKKSFSADGSDLAICLYRPAKAGHAIRLLSSIEYYVPNFKGEIIIVDNNTSEEEKKIFEEYISTSSLLIVIKELNGNYKISQARNLSANTTEKNWLMFLDIDMFFIKNPLPAIKKTIEYLGVHYLNLPIISNDNKTIFALGGALFTDSVKNSNFLGGGSCFNFKQSTEFHEVNIEFPFLSDYMFGDACVINRSAFIDEGGFSEEVSSGSEDIDFSFRLYDKGIKIGNMNTFTLVANKKASNELSEIEIDGKPALEIVNDGLESKKEAIYNKNTEKWIKRKTGKKVALIVDVKEWAFHNIAKNVEACLSDKFEFKIFFQADFTKEKWLDLYVLLFKERFDVIMFFWRPSYKQLFSYELKRYLEFKCQISAEAFEQFLNETVLLTGVYDHLFLDSGEIKNNLDIFSNDIDGYFVSSNKLKEIYEGIPGYIKPYTVIQDGVDTNKFYKKEGATFSDPSSPLVVGWAGNSKWGVAVDGIDHKGFDTIIKPAVAELIEEGYNIKLIYADRQEPKTHIPRSKMNDFYNSLDLYLCTSDIEGTPNPVLESMACGIGIISTDVGIIKEVFGKEQQKFILEERSKECLKKKLITVLNDRSILNTLAKENEIRISNWTWKSKCEKFEDFFNYYLGKKNTGNLHKKKFPYSTDIVSAEVEALMNDNTAAVNSDEFRYIQREAVYWKQSASEIQKWYQQEYEVLPLWYKRFGHIIKMFQGQRTFKSLFSNNGTNK